MSSARAMSADVNSTLDNSPARSIAAASATVTGRSLAICPPLPREGPTALRGPGLFRTRSWRRDVSEGGPGCEGSFTPPRRDPFQRRSVSSVTGEHAAQVVEIDPFTCDRDARRGVLGAKAAGDQAKPCLGWEAELRGRHGWPIDQPHGIGDLDAERALRLDGLDGDN